MVLLWKMDLKTDSHVYFTVDKKVLGWLGLSTCVTRDWTLLIVLITNLLKIWNIRHSIKWFFNMLLASVNKCFISIYLCQHVSLTFFQTSLSSVNSGIKDTHMYNKSYVYKGLCNTNCYMRQYFLVLHRQLDVDSTTALMLCVCLWFGKQKTILSHLLTMIISRGWIYRTLCLWILYFCSE